MSEKNSFLIIFLVAFLGIGKIINYYFFYDDFFLFYAIQFPNDKNSIFLSPDASAYRFLQPFFSPLFNIFKYEPKGYFIISFLLFIALLLVFYFFVKKFSFGNKKLAFFSSLIAASGYVGVEAFTWNMGAGPNNTVFLITSFLTLLFVFSYLRLKRLIFLSLIFASFTFTVYFFQFRAFLLFLWIILTILVWIFWKKAIPGRFIVFLTLLMFFGVFLYKESFSFNDNQGIRIGISFIDFIQIYLRNIGNIIFPSGVTQFVSGRLDINLEKIEVYEGIFGFVFLISVPIIAFIQRLKELPILIFFSFSTLFSALLLYVVISLTINAPDVWYSSHRFHFIIMPFLAGFLGTVLVILFKKYRIISVILLMFWLVIHIVLSNNVIDRRWENPISHIQYFYKTLQKYAPVFNEDSVLLITQGDPKPVSIFVSARSADGFAGIAGFYSKTVDQINLARSPEEAVQMLKRLGVTEDNLYSLHYKRGELLNLTGETREILAKGKNEFLGTQVGNNIEFAGLSLPAYALIYADLKLTIMPDFYNLKSLQKIDQARVTNPEQYFPLIIEQERQRKAITTSSLAKPLEDHVVQNITDGDYSTTWIPEKWDNNGVSVIVDLGRLRRANKIVWSSSRTASWYVRMPSEYKVEISHDGKIFTQISLVNNAPVLKSGEFFEERFSQKMVRFIKITINKTRGGLAPAIDEIEVFDKNSDSVSLNDYFIVKQNPQAYLSSVVVAKRYMEEILNNSIAAEIGWRVDGNTDYSVGQSVIISQNAGETQSLHVLLPVLGRELKSLKIKPLNFPAKIRVEDFTIFYPRLSDSLASE